MVLAVATIMGALAIAFGMPALRSFLEGGHSPARFVLVIDVLGMALALPLGLMGIAAYRLGRRVVAAEAFPPPGLPALRATAQITGPAARRLGKAAMLMALVLIAAGAAIPFFAHHVATRIAGAG